MSSPESVIDIHSHFFPETWPDLAERFGTPDWPWLRHLGDGKAMVMVGEKDFRRANPRFQPRNFRQNMGYVRALRSFAASKGWTTTALALAWVLDRGEHLIPIPATRSAAHLAEWTGADEIVLSDADRAEIDRIMPVGWAMGDRYSYPQLVGIERYC